MNIITAYAVKNDCYKKAQKMTPAGIVVHSTGANNPNLKRYVDAPDEVGVNQYGNHWNNSAADMGRSVCVHSFIGYDKNKTVRVANILPYNYCCWGVGNGPKGSYNYNPAYIQFEMCEDGLTDKTYFAAVRDVAIEYCAYLCKEFNLSVDKIVSHKEAHAMGYGSNHGDPDNWWSKHSYNMDMFRAAVKAKLADQETKVEAPTQKSIDEIAREVIAGKWGNGETRKQKLTAAGYDYSAVQKRVNELVNPTTAPAKKSVDEIAREVIVGKWGNGETRKQKLTAAGYDYSAVQKRVNELVNPTTAPAKKSVDEIAREVIAGKWGNGATRKQKLAAAGYDYSTVQKRVNELLK